MKTLVESFSPKVIFAIVMWVAIPFAAHAEVISIDPVDRGLFASAQPTLTLYWQGKESRAVLIFIPGGEGHIGLKEGQTDHRSQFHQMLKRLTNPSLTSGRFDVVLFDSPYELSPRQPYPAARGGRDHLSRIESVVRYYQEKTRLPVWLMGHSNGGISLTEFVKTLQEENRTNLIAGMIVSGVRSETYFNAPLSMPILFMHHRQDGCLKSAPGASYSNFGKVNEFNKSLTEFAYVSEGRAESQDACRSGYHMYFGASEEAAGIIDAFLSKLYQ